MITYSIIGQRHRITTSTVVVQSQTGTYFPRNISQCARAIKVRLFLTTRQDRTIKTCGSGPLERSFGNGYMPPDKQLLSSQLNALTFNGSINFMTSILSGGIFLEQVELFLPCFPYWSNSTDTGILDFRCRRHNTGLIYMNTTTYGLTGTSGLTVEFRLSSKILVISDRRSSESPQVWYEFKRTTSETRPMRRKFNNNPLSTRIGDDTVSGGRFFTVKWQRPLISKQRHHAVRQQLRGYWHGSGDLNSLPITTLTTLPRP